MGNPVSSPHTAASGKERTQHQAPIKRGQRKYAHNVPQSNDSYMRLRLLGEMYTKLSDEAYAKHNEAYIIGVAYV